mmetsp:Transcript_5064/g.15176  ORF Transcript_5064/g.15176 Transcript_5064/m.15176 type:complete len:251 (-) Transcript_5064:3799-4551(-)
MSVHAKSRGHHLDRLGSWHLGLHRLLSVTLAHPGQMLIREKFQLTHHLRVFEAYSQHKFSIPSASIAKLDVVLLNRNEELVPNVNDGQHHSSKVRKVCQKLGPSYNSLEIVVFFVCHDESAVVSNAQKSAIAATQTKEPPVDRLQTEPLGSCRMRRCARHIYFVGIDVNVALGVSAEVDHQGVLLQLLATVAGSQAPSKRLPRSRSISVGPQVSSSLRCDELVVRSGDDELSVVQEQDLEHVRWDLSLLL